MKLSEYFKSRLWTFVVWLFVSLLLLAVLYAFELPTHAVLFVMGLIALGFTLSEVPDFFRRKRFYDELMSKSEELDKKYLLSEITEQPAFYDGQMLCSLLRQAGRSMNETVGQYRRESADFREYIELWVHEIKLPVSALQLMCHNDDGRYSCQLARIDGCIENVLYYARGESAEKDYIIRPVSLKRIFADTALKYREELLRRNITIRASIPDVKVMTDGKWLSYMLGQLMSNSIKYIPADREGIISVFAEDMPDKTLLRFRDNGIGIPASDLPHIFDKSFTGENGRQHAKSTGMGLYLVKKLCDKLGHGLSASSVTGEYTEITFSFGKDNLLNVTNL